ncbi:MAG: phage terminase small subunit P27 family [Actinobacteria bacterium]|nr:phage terminase small subunit P27 family [Actinomycetota bacterium]
MSKKKQHLRPPDHLDRTGAALWRKLVSEFSQEEGLLQSLDIPMLVVFCDSYSIYVRASRQIKKDGLMVQGSRGMVAHKLLPVRREAANMIAKIGPAFGLTPLDRERLMILLEKADD